MLYRKTDVTWDIGFCPNAPNITIGTQSSKLPSLSYKIDDINYTTLDNEIYTVSSLLNNITPNIINDSRILKLLHKKKYYILYKYKIRDDKQILVFSTISGINTVETVLYFIMNPDNDINYDDIIESYYTYKYIDVSIIPHKYIYLFGMKFMIWYKTLIEHMKTFTECNHEYYKIL